MPLEWEQEHDTGLVVVRALGKVAPGAYFEIWDEVMADPHIGPGPRILADFRKVEVTKTGAEVRGVAATAMRFNDFMQGGRMAVVATQDASFGLARLYAAHLDAADIQARVFRDYDEARTWALESLAGEAPE